MSDTTALVRFLSATPALGRQVYATGMSNGGFMSHRLGCEASHVFAAIAPVSGLLANDSSHAGLGWLAQAYPCAPANPVHEQEFDLGVTVLAPQALPLTSCHVPLSSLE